MIEICAVGGYDEIGRNMTAVRIDDEVIIFDCGIHLEPLIQYTQDEEAAESPNERILHDVGAIPDHSVIKDWEHMVKAVIPSHAHLDHIGGLPYCAQHFDAPIFCTPYTAEVLRSMLRDNHKNKRLEISEMSAGNSYQLTPHIEVEFVHMTHSIPDTVCVVLHTKYGAIIYANDFSLDQTPVQGFAGNMNRLEEISQSKNGVLALICDSTNADKEGNTPSELDVYQQLQELMHEDFAKKHAIVVTTFASHIHRLHTILKCAEQLGRTPLFVGRSMRRYIKAAHTVGIHAVPEGVDIAGFSSKIARKLKKVKLEGKDKYLVVATGHQGEPGSGLDKIMSGRYDFTLEKGDHVIFSCKVIPTEMNQLNRANLEAKMVEKGVVVHKDIHASGHASMEDLVTFIGHVKPKHFIPSHGFEEKRMANAHNAQRAEIKSIHQLSNGERVRLV